MECLSRGQVARVFPVPVSGSLQLRCARIYHGEEVHVSRILLLFKVKPLNITRIYLVQVSTQQIYMSSPYTVSHPWGQLRHLYCRTLYRPTPSYTILYL